MHTQTSHLKDSAPPPISTVSSSSHESSSRVFNLGFKRFKHLRAVNSLLGQPLQSWDLSHFSYPAMRDTTHSQH